MPSDVADRFIKAVDDLEDPLRILNALYTQPDSLLVSAPTDHFGRLQISEARTMLVCSFTQTVWRWLAPEQVLEGLQAWAQQQQSRVPSLQVLGLFGSYGRGTAYCGSDLDLILVDAGVRGGQVERLQQWPLAELQLSFDVLVLTPAELEQRLNDGSCISMELKRDLRWLL